MFSNDNELKKYFYLISYAGIILAIILNLSSVLVLFNIFGNYLLVFYYLFVLSLDPN